MPHWTKKGSSGDGNYFGFATRLRLGRGSSEKLMFGLFPIVERVAGGPVALQVDVVGTQGDFIVSGRHFGYGRFARFGCCCSGFGGFWAFLVLLLILFSQRW